MKAHGKARMIGDNLNTDQLYPTRYVNTSDPREMAKHCMEDYDKTFIDRIEPGDIITAGKNFGCGSSREHAPRSIKAAGISCVIAKGFSRIFYRNAINIGLPIVMCAEAVEEASEGDELTVDFDDGIITNERIKKIYRVPQYPEFLQEIIQCGGLMAKIDKSR